MGPLTLSSNRVNPVSGALSLTTEPSAFSRPRSRHVPSYLGFSPMALACPRFLSRISWEQWQW